ncbi:MAG: spore germination protein [Clostridia bacterium]|nr:spore germination protein [Clostridia bacterium]
MNISKSLNENVKNLKNLIDSDDVFFYNFEISSTSAVAVFLDSLSDKVLIGKQVIEPFKTLDNSFDFQSVLNAVNAPEVEEVLDVNSCAKKVCEGDAIIFVEGFNKALNVKCKKPTSRAVTEPPTSSVLKGPREGFVENLQMNTSLLRQRIKSPDLCIKKYTVGKYSSTTIEIVYISSIANNNIVKAVTEKIKKINVDGIIDSSYIIKCISDRKTTLFRQVGTTEKPDILSAKLLEGRIGIMVDGSPIALTVPFLFIEDFQSSEDYYVNAYRANLSRTLRVLAVIFAIILPSFFVAAQLFHLQIIPLNFLLTIVGSIKGIPLSPSVEMFFTLFIFEILNEASIRMPRYVGIAMSVVGALVLGETAVNAGIVSTPTIMIMALSGICIYTVPDMTETLSVLRILFLIIAGSFGGFGIVLFGCALITYLSDFDSFGVPYLSPYSPIIKNDLQDAITMSFYAEMKRRPASFKPKNVIRKKF